MAASRVVPLFDRSLIAPVVRVQPAARRLRLEIPGLEHDAALRGRVVEELRRRLGPCEVDVNAASGRVLVIDADGARLRDAIEKVQRRRAKAPTRPEPHPWHAWPAGRVLDALGSREHGLTSAEAAARLEH